MKHLFLLPMLLCSTAAFAVGDKIHPSYQTLPELFAGSSNTEKDFNEIQITKQLKNVPKDFQRLPLITWNLSAKALNETQIKQAYAKGIAPWVRLNPDYISTAERLKALNIPIMALHLGEGNNWPYRLSNKRWALSKDNKQASPLRLDGYRIAADQLRQKIQAFDDKQLKPTAIWFDIESPPILTPLSDVLASDDKKLFPAEAISSEKNWGSYQRQLWLQIMSAYIAAPVLETWPDIPFTNWINTLSGTGMPVRSWNNWYHPNHGSNLFTATGPVAYAIDTAFSAVWQDSFSFDQQHIDQAYTHIMLRQVTADSWQRQTRAPWLKSMVWVSRWVPDEGYNAAPVMSRKAYRESLRHLWLRDIDAMGIFNAVWSNYGSFSATDLEDAQQVFAETVDWEDVLATGEAMNLQIPPVQCQCAIWSGMINNNTAIIRVGSQDEKTHHIKVKLWNNKSIELLGSPTARTYIISRLENGIKIQ